jgi:hypothetical protein
MATAMYTTRMHAPQLNYRGNGRRAPWHHARGAQRPRATLNCNYTTTMLLYYRIQETPRPRAPEDTRGGQERRQEDRRETRGDRSGPQGHSHRDPTSSTGTGCYACIPLRLLNLKLQVKLQASRTSGMCPVCYKAGNR